MAVAQAGALTLTAAPATVPLVGGEWPETAIWAYNGIVPGPAIRVRQGDTVRVTARNGLAEPTTVHWHGIRLPNAMDGVPDVTQKPISPGGEFNYEFQAVDAGSFWYHPHFNSPEQQGRGLSGPLIVEEREPLAVDRDVTWVIDDWLLRDTAQIDDSFGQAMQSSHGGRMGNTVTVNGRIPDAFRVRAGERIRLRLINVANARTFALDFGALKPRIVALDGQPVAPQEPHGGRVVLAAAQRADLVIDMAGRPGDSVPLTDGYYRGRTYDFLTVQYEDAPPLRESPLDAPIALAANPLPSPIVDDQAQRERIVLEGGAMGRFPSGADSYIEQGQFWFVNGLPDKGRAVPLIDIARGRTCVIELVNQTGWEHPMHLHGFAFRVLTRNGAPNIRGEWLDTVLVQPRETVEIAFVADSPGDWLFHCHILEHMAAGMSGIVRVV
jgi:FtsP/CotA-like multicopper oxidase with cupredoxin domain